MKDRTIKPDTTKLAWFSKSGELVIADGRARRDIKTGEELVSYGVIK